jgi:hypothetical protein
MADNAQKTPLGLSLNRWGKQIAQNAVEKVAKALPASVLKVMGAIVEVGFSVNGNTPIPSVTVPILGSQYIRLPIQPGELGVTLSADAYLGGMSGLGGGTAGQSQPGNLTSLVWAPIGNKNWPSTDPNTLTMKGGPNGISLASADGSTSISITSGGISITTGGDLVVNGISFLHHVHGGVQTGGGESGPPV